MSIKDLTIGELIGLLNSVGDAKPSEAKEAGIEIVVLARGWVVVGFVHYASDQLTISKAKVVRKWGTSRGLGQLASEGPLEKTKLDDGGIVKCHPMSIVCSFDCSKEKWDHVLR